MNNQITQSELKRLLSYSPTTGIFTWNKKMSNHVPAGSEAGHITKTGHRRLCVNRKIYLVHRLAWLYMTGEWPPDQIDHINHNRNDNRWNNLRCVTQQENQRNASLSKANKSGVTGVYWNKTNKKWEANIKISRKKKYLGLFDDKFEAICCRKSAERKYNFHENHGR